MKEVQLTQGKVTLVDNEDPIRVLLLFNVSVLNNLICLSVIFKIIYEKIITIPNHFY